MAIMDDNGISRCTKSVIPRSIERGVFLDCEVRRHVICNSAAEISANTGLCLQD